MNLAPLLLGNGREAHRRELVDLVRVWLGLGLGLGGYGSVRVSYRYPYPYPYP